MPDLPTPFAETEFQGPSHICLGRFRYYPEALLVKNRLNETGAVLESSVQIIGDTAEVPIDNFLDYLPRIFPVIAQSPGAAIPYKEFSERGDYIELKNLDTPRTQESYRAALQIKADQTPLTDPLYGYLHLNLGIFESRAEKAEAALPHYLKVIDPQSHSLPIHRVMAMRRIAWIYHHQGDRLKAYQAYSELQEQALGPATVATCVSDRLGLLMELAESGNKGTHDNVRHAYAAWLDDIPTTYTRERAVCDLIFLESYSRQTYIQSRPDVAAALSDEFVQYYGAMGGKKPMREYGAAMRQAGMYHARAGNAAKSREYYARVFREIPPDVETFRGYHPHADALIGLSNLAQAEGRAGEMNQIRRDILEFYPKTIAAEAIRREYPNLESSLAPSADPMASMLSAESAVEE